MKLPSILLQAHHERYGQSPTAAASAPGRVNLLGDHVDYNQGLALPAAIGARAWACATPIAEPRLELHAVDFQDGTELELDQLSGGPCSELELPGWACYPAGVAWALLQVGASLPGLRCSLHSQVPIGSGLSSSAAVEVAVAMLLLEVSGYQRSPLELARLCQRAENEFVGVQSGVMDQWAAASAQAGSALLLDFQALTSQSIPWPEGISIVVASSGVERELTDSLYNERVSECHDSLAILRESKPALRSLRDLPADQLDWAQARLPEILFKRVRHVVTEIERVRRGSGALAAGDVNAFGALMIASHASLKDDYQVSLPELDLLAAAAADHPACHGARLTGAGFGGCTVQIVAEAQVSDFSQSLRERYAQETGRAPEMWAWRPGQGALSHPV